MVNYTSLGYESLDEYNIDFFGTLLETNHTYEFFVNWEKVFNNLKDHLIEISILNSLRLVRAVWRISFIEVSVYERKNKKIGNVFFIQKRGMLVPFCRRIYYQAVRAADLGKVHGGVYKKHQCKGGRRTPEAVFKRYTALSIFLDITYFLNDTPLIPENLFEKALSVKPASCATSFSVIFSVTLESI